jgi:4-hydroxybenzoate polyprenyltransferase
MNALQQERSLPLCVNCEGALLRTSVAQETLFASIRRHPLRVLLLPLWLLRRGTPPAADGALNWRTAPLFQGVHERLRGALAQGRRVILVTSQPGPWAAELAATLEGAEPLLLPPSAQTAGSRLQELFGQGGFDYIGDGRHDLDICRAAHSTVLVSSNAAVIARTRAVARVEEVVPRDNAGLVTYLKMIRVHQWLKNLLIFVPLLAAHKLTSSDSVRVALASFLAFSFCASAVYITNDLLDLEADRLHVRKRNRALAAGRIPLSGACGVALALLAVGAALAVSISALFVATLGLYFVMTLAYSLRLKRQVIVDVMLLAGLYTIRVVAGAVAVTVVPSFWLLALSMFMFLSLAIVKRYSEMLVTLSQEQQYAAGRGYSVHDLPVLLSLGIASGMAAIVVLALYIDDPVTHTLYPHTLYLWPIPPLMLYWISRVWMKSHRGEMHDDPVVFAIRDWQSLMILVLGAACFFAAAH